MESFSIRDEFPELPRVSKISVCVLACNAGTHFLEEDIFIRSEVIMPSRKLTVLPIVTNHYKWTEAS